MVPKHEEPDEFVAALQGVAGDVLRDTRGEEVAQDPAAVRAVVESLGRALRSRGLKIAHLNVVPGDVTS